MLPHATTMCIAIYIGLKCNFQGKGDKMMVSGSSITMASSWDKKKTKKTSS